MNTYRWLTERIHAGHDPYAGFDPAQYPHELSGWDSDHHWFGECIERLRPAVVIEVGSWLGGSAIHMAGHLKRLGLDAAIVCVDTWLGDRQLWTRDEHRRNLAFRHGRPTVYNSFVANVIDAGLSGYIVPLSMDSACGAHYLAHCEISAELIYIDGCHEEGEVYRDLELYWKRLRPGGVMLIDDYVPNTNNNQVFHGLIRDVQKFAGERGLVITHSGRKALLEKDT